MAPAGVPSALDARPATPVLNRIVCYQALLVVAIFVLWEILVRAKILPVYLYGQPSGIVVKAYQLLTEGDLLKHVAATAFASVTGFVLGTSLGRRLGC